MTTIKRILALALALMMVLGLVACGAEPTNPSQNGTQPSQNVQQPTEDNNDPAPTNADKPSGEKRVITIGVWWDFYYDSTHEDVLDDPSYVGSPADEARWAIIELIEETYNVEIQYVNLTYTGVVESINTSILAGTPDCDIYLCEPNFGVPAVLNGLAIDLKTVLPADSDILSDQNVLNYLDLGDGKVCLMKRVTGEETVGSTYPLAFNKQMLEDNNLEDPRDLYARGEWTWAKFVEYCQKLTQDTDGDGVVDQYGFAGFCEDVVAQLIMANGGAIAATETEGLSSPAVVEALQFYSDLYNTYKVCAPYPAEDNGDVTRYQYRDGNVAFWPCAAWINAANNDYDWDGSTGVTLDFDTVYVQWPVGPSGNQETNRAKLVGGSYWFIPVGTEDPELVYNVFEMLSNWYRDDVELRDDIETMWWWYASTAKEEDIQYSNYDVMFDVGSRESFDLYQSLGYIWNLQELIDGTSTAAQFAETYKQQFQEAIDALYG